MTRDLLIRGLPDEDFEWIENATPPGMTRSAFLRELISSARQSPNFPSQASHRGRPTESAFTFIDLFAGIGGFYMGLTANGGSCVFSCEWDKYAVATYRAWTGVHDVAMQDVRELSYRTAIPHHDILAAGFPCQPFSLAGVSKKNALNRLHGFRDREQGNLFFAICDIIDAKRPPALILENVKNLRSHDDGRTWKVVSDSLNALGYEMHYRIIDARAWVPQHRERIFMVCFDRAAFTSSEIAAFRFPREPTRTHKLSDILDSEPPDRKYMLTDGLWRYLRDYSEKHKARGNGFGYGLFGPDDVARTLSARYYKDGSEILIRQRGWRNPRRLTPLEAARLMGYNSRYSRRMGHGKSFPQVVSDSQAYRQLGNSVCPPVVEAIGRQVVRVLRLRATRLAGIEPL